MPQINIIELRRQIAIQEAAVIQPRMKEVLNKKFEEDKQWILNEFDNHPVTKELKAGPDAQSKFVKTAHGGNLFSLLGFVKAVDPTDEIRNALLKDITKGRVTREVKAGNKLAYNLEVRVPTLAELRRRGQLLTWTTRSFLDLIEKGIDNFRKYLFDDSGRLKKYSRSGTAIQIEGNIKKGRKDSVKGIPYVSKLINDFQKRLRSFNK